MGAENGAGANGDQDRDRFPSHPAPRRNAGSTAIFNHRAIAKLPASSAAMARKHLGDFGDKSRLVAGARLPRRERSNDLRLSL